MIFGARLKRAPMAGLIAAFVISGGMLAGAETRSLVENSPFLPEGFVPPADRRQQPAPEPPPEPESSPLDSIEYRGMYAFGGRHHFSFYDSENQQSFWLTSDQMDDEFVVVEFDERADSVVMRHGDVERPITMRESQIRELTGRQARAQQAGASNDTQTQAERQQQLREAAEELRQRRAIRTPRN